VRERGERTTTSTTAREGREANVSAAINDRLTFPLENSFFLKEQSKKKETQKKGKRTGFSPFFVNPVFVVNWGVVSASGVSDDARFAESFFPVIIS
jgi:hypothetical protein